MQRLAVEYYSQEYPEGSPSIFQVFLHMTIADLRKALAEERNVPPTELVLYAVKDKTKVGKTAVNSTHRSQCTTTRS